MTISDKLDYISNAKVNRKQMEYICEIDQEVNMLKRELQRKDNIINDLKSSIADYQEAVGDYQDELKRKDNNWNELKKYVMSCYIVGHTVQNGTINQILDKIKELESK